MILICSPNFNDTLHRPNQPFRAASYPVRSVVSRSRCPFFGSALRAPVFFKFWAPCDPSCRPNGAGYLIDGYDNALCSSNTAGVVAVLQAIDVYGKKLSCLISHLPQPFRRSFLRALFRWSVTSTLKHGNWAPTALVLRSKRTPPPSGWPCCKKCLVL